MSGTPDRCISAFAADLDPMTRIADAGGPIKVTPADTQASANSAFSDRKPYPGWTASTLLSRTTSRITPMFR